jgi:hypothetical protein
MRIKLLGNADRYPTLQSKLSYAFSRLEGIAANQFLQYVDEGGITLPSMLRFYEILIQLLGTPIECVRLEGTFGTSVNEIERSPTVSLSFNDMLLSRVWMKSLGSRL